MRFLPERAREERADARWRSSSAASSSTTRATSSTSIRRPRRTALNKLLFESRHSQDAAQPHRQRLRERWQTSTSCTGSSARRREAMINVGKGGTGQRSRRAARRGRLPPAAGADVAARDLLDDATSAARRRWPGKPSTNELRRARTARSDRSGRSGVRIVQIVGSFWGRSARSDSSVICASRVPRPRAGRVRVGSARRCQTYRGRPLP